MTPDEYEKAIESFLGELQSTMSALKNDRLGNSVDLLADLEELKIRMQEPNITDADLIGFCFGIVDDYLKYFGKEAISNGLNLYQDMHFGSK